MFFIQQNIVFLQTKKFNGKINQLNEVIRKLYTVIALIIIMLGGMSCSEKQNGMVLSKDFQDEVWNRFDYLYATYNVVAAPMTADLVMEMDVSDVFPNIYPYYDDENGIFAITLSINAPDGSSRARDFRFRIKDSEGNFKSEKIKGYYHFELPLINDMSFNENGEYHFKIENKYSKDPLYGIKSLNINCLQIKKK